MTERPDNLERLDILAELHRLRNEVTGLKLIVELTGEALAKGKTPPLPAQLAEAVEALVEDRDALVERLECIERAWVDFARMRPGSHAELEEAIKGPGRG